jgi:hypothetical protein
LFLQITGVGNSIPFGQNMVKFCHLGQLSRHTGHFPAKWPGILAKSLLRQPLQKASACMLIGCRVYTYWSALASVLLNVRFKNTCNGTGGTSVPVPLTQ